MRPLLPLGLRCLWLGLLLSLMACAGPRRIVVVNETGKKATVVWGLKPEPRLTRPSSMLEVDTLYTFLDTKGPERMTGLVFGDGKWDYNEYRRVGRRLMFIDVVDPDGEVVMRVDRQDSIPAVLAAHVRGIRKREVRLVVK